MVVEKHYGREMAAMRREAGISQENIADKIGITQEMISYIENSKIPPIENWIKYMNVLGRDLTDLFGRDHLTIEEQELLRLFKSAPEAARKGIIDILECLKK